MGRPKKLTPTIEKAPPRLAGAMDLLPEHHMSLDVFSEKLLALAHTFGYAKVEPRCWRTRDCSIFGHRELIRSSLSTTPKIISLLLNRQIYSVWAVFIWSIIFLNGRR